MEIEPKILIKSQHSYLENFNSHFLISETNISNINMESENVIATICYDACDQLSSSNKIQSTTRLR